ncbi:MAG: VWA domain-containing protein, partial [Clostridia bacterium]|nr:VWA domain-containing protein [Clostridia bacterium]
MNKRFERVLSLFMGILLVLCNFGTVPAALASETEGVSQTVGNITKLADSTTVDTWKPVFLGENGVINTTAAGTVWSDKSVFATVDDYMNDVDEATSDEIRKGLALEDESNFLVALSTIASAKSIEGYVARPSDTILVLDLSASMDGHEANMIDAANQAIDKLLTLNPNNRIGVVAYSGNSQTGNSAASTANVILPLGKYTKNNNGVYLVSSWRTQGQDRTGIRAASGVTGTVAKGVGDDYPFNSFNPAYKTTSGGTYTQNGLALAMKMFDALDDSEVKVTGEDNVQYGMERIPIFVLFSDGNPTAATTNYSNYADIGTSKLGNGSAARANDDMKFVTQLTAAYVRAKAEEKYNNDALFYTLGLGDIDEAVLNPSENTSRMVELWNAFKNLSDGGRMQITEKTGDNSTESHNITKELPYEGYTWSENYVDEYFYAQQSSDLVNAFNSIVEQIILQSLYRPTMVDEGDTAHHDGFIEFQDYIGAGMEVKAIKGIQLGDKLYTGKTLAQMMASGALGTPEAPTEIGNEVLFSVQDRLGITANSPGLEGDTAVEKTRKIIALAWENGQLAYNASTGEFSNYIGWYASTGDANTHELVFEGFWDGSEDHTNAPEKAVFAVKSYSFFDAVGEGHRQTDMMYATIQVRTNIKDAEDDASKAGDIRVIGRLPASLIPLIEYNIEVNDANPLSPKSMEIVEATPSRLIYEVGLKDDIDPLTIADNAALASHKGSDGKYVFYTNDWQSLTDAELNGEGYSYLTNRNATSFFEPSEENEAYYYSVDTPVFSDQDGNHYEDDSAPDKDSEVYRRYIRYTKNGSTVSAEYVYEPIPEEVLADATKNLTKQADGTWIVNKGTPYRYSTDAALTSPFVKKDNETNTLPIALQKFHHAQSVGKITDHYHLDTWLGNNGKLVIDPYEGIKITKKIDETITDLTTVYTFNVTTNDFNGTCTLVIENKDGSREDARTISFTNNTAQVQLKEGQSAYILSNGVMAGKTFTVSEVDGAGYSIKSVKVNGKSVSGTVAEIEVSADSITPVEFENTKTKLGSAVISKTVNGTIPDGKPTDFSFSLKITGEDIVQGAAYQAVKTKNDNSSSESITLTVDANGAVTPSFTLKHGETLTINGLPVGSVVEATETDYSGEDIGTMVKVGEGAAVVSLSAGTTVAEENTPAIAFTNVYP